MLGGSSLVTRLTLAPLTPFHFPHSSSTPTPLHLVCRGKITAKRHLKKLEKVLRKQGLKVCGTSVLFEVMWNAMSFRGQCRYSGEV